MKPITTKDIVFGTKVIVDKHEMGIVVDEVINYNPNNRSIIFLKNGGIIFKPFDNVFLYNAKNKAEMMLKSETVIVTKSKYVTNSDQT